MIVTRLIIENSIESRILELQRKKEAMTSCKLNFFFDRKSVTDVLTATLGDDDSGMGRLTPEDLRFLFSL